ncbi:hypothetical protein O5624_02490 [Escherichia coli]|nr:hypothetical protein [Escherichia coli]
MDNGLLPFAIFNEPIPLIDFSFKKLIASLFLAGVIGERLPECEEQGQGKTDKGISKYVFHSAWYSNSSPANHSYWGSGENPVE